MGNQTPGSVGPQQGDMLRSTLLDIPAYVYQCHLGGGKVFKTVQCLHDEGFVVVKVYIKRDKGLSLKRYQVKLSELEKKFQLHLQPGIIIMRRLDQTDKAAYLVRQFFAYNLHDRFHTHPFLTQVEKKWFAFQLLTALTQMHGLGVRHGDIKSENIMVTTWNWCFLTDIAFYKPTYLPADNPADYSFYFDSGQRRRCYLAPERFYSQLNDRDASAKDDANRAPGQGGSDGLVAESMDIFSAGCVIAEIFLEGEAIFDLPQLLAYREGKYDPTPLINKISSPDVRTLILHMIQREPTKRHSAKSYLKQWSKRTFPRYFPFLYKFFAKLLSPELADADIKIQAIKHYDHVILREIVGVEVKAREKPPMSQPLGALDKDNDVDSDAKDPSSSASTVSTASSAPASAPAPVEEKPHKEREKLPPVLPELVKFAQQLDKSTTSLAKPAPVNTASSTSASSAPLTSPKPASKILSFFTKDKSDKGDKEKGDSKKSDDVSAGAGRERSSAKISDSRINEDNGQGLTMIVSMICSCLGNVRYPLTKLTALELLLQFGAFVDDDIRLGRLLPFTVAMLSDTSAIVRATAVRTLTQTLARVTILAERDAHIFPEYILPSLSRFPSDHEELVRLAYSQTIAQLSEISRNFLDISHFAQRQAQLKALSVASLIPPPSPSLNSTTLQQQQPDTVSTTGGAAGAAPQPALADVNTSSYDQELGHLQETVLKLVIDMLTVGGSKVKRSLLKDITRLCIFMGRQRVNNELLPHLITVLNDRDWQLRSAFFEHIVGVSVFVGRAAFQNFILPCVEQALFDVEEFVVQRAVHSLTSLCELGLFEKRIMLDMVTKVAPLLCHPSTWIRNETIDFVANMSATLGAAKSYCFVVPALKPFLRDDLLQVTRASLILCLKPPITRTEFRQAIKQRVLRGVVSPASGRKQDNKDNKSDEKTATGDSVKTAGGGDGEIKRQRTDNDAALPSMEPGSPESEFSEREPGSALPHATSAMGLGSLAASPGDVDGHSEIGQYLHSMSSPTAKRGKEKEKGGVGGGEVSSGYLDDKLLADAMLHYITRVASAMQVKGGGMSSSGDDDRDPEQPLTEEEESLQSRYSGLENEIQLYCLEVEKTTPDTTGEFYSPIDKVQQDLFESLGVQVSYEGGGGGGGGEDGDSGVPRRQSGAADILQQRLIGNGPTESKQQRSKPALKQALEKVPDYIQKALSIPPPTPNLGELVTDTISHSAFYKNFHRLENSADPVDPKQWRPKGVLVTTLQEHKGPVNQISVSRDNLFIVSGSDDGTVKIWDSQRLKVTSSVRSQLTYAIQRGRITSVTVCDSSHAVASASDNGSVHVFKVEYVNKANVDASQRYAGLSDVKKVDVAEEGAVLCVEHFNSVTESLLVYGSKRGFVHGWDLRAQAEAFLVHLDPSLGTLTKLAVGPSPYCLIGGTNRGFIVLWDLRFQIPIQIWRHSSKAAVMSLTPVDTPSVLPRKKNQLQHPTKGPLLFASTENSNQIEAFDLYTGEVRMLLRVTAQNPSLYSTDKNAVALQPGNDHASSQTPSQTPRPNQSSQQTPSKPVALPFLRSYVNHDSHMPTLDDEFQKELAGLVDSVGAYQPSIRAFLCCPEGFGLTAGSDRAVRYWDFKEPADSYLVSTDNEATLDPFHLRYTTRLDVNAVLFEEVINAHVDDKKDKAVVPSSVEMDEKQQQEEMRMKLSKKTKGPVPPPGTHRDQILDMKALEFPQKMLATCSRDGAVKIWV